MSSEISSGMQSYTAMENSIIGNNYVAYEFIRLRIQTVLKRYMQYFE